MHKKGLTLIEILVSAIILALVLTGLVNIFVAGKRYILHTRSRMTAAELSGFFLDPLQMQVRQDTWTAATNCLGTGNCPAETWTIDIPYTVAYQWTIVPGTDLRKVIANITWTELSP